MHVAQVVFFVESPRLYSVDHPTQDVELKRNEFDEPVQVLVVYTLANPVVQSNVNDLIADAEKKVPPSDT